MKPYRLLLYALFYVLLSCTSKPEGKVVDKTVKSKTIVTPTINVSGTCYFFGREFNAETCEADSTCDCCSMLLLFIDDENFITIHPCESEETLLRGTYKVVNGKVILSYDTLQVDRDYNFELEADTLKSDKPEYLITLKKAEVTSEILESSSCHGKFYLEAKDDDGIMYGTVDAQYSLNERIQQLKDEGVWDEIQQ
jgi:hypothetical protein